jgi:hypothetical protein
LQIKKLKSKRKWRRSHNTEDVMPDPVMPDPTEMHMAQRRMEEIEQQYALEKEVCIHIIVIILCMNVLKCTCLTNSFAVHVLSIIVCRY